MYRSYTVRLKPTRRQGEYMAALLAELCELYNAALQERREANRVANKNVTYYEQQKELTQLRAVSDESRGYPIAVQRDPLRRVDKAFRRFFAGLKSGKAFGFPRFRSLVRYDSFDVDSGNFVVGDGFVKLPNLGAVKLRTRCHLRGTPKVVHVKRVGNKWQARICCDIGPAPEKVVVKSVTGIDVGLTTLATLSDGTEVENPRWTAREADRLASANRNLALKTRGSKNRAKAREHLRRVHQRIQGLRRSYLHDVSNWLIANYDLIAYEKLTIMSMARGNFYKSIMDAAWRQLLNQIVCKAEWAGKYAVEVASGGTTQLCSGCGEKVPKTLKERTHNCGNCGLTLGRDHNAAINVLNRGVRSVGLVPAIV